ncbi:hypothetical protein JZU54_01595, partial [bacterium]|nr:hypothetical protein [bacterium]
SFVDDVCDGVVEDTLPTGVAITLFLPSCKFVVDITYDVSVEGNDASSELQSFCIDRWVVRWDGSNFEM